MNKHTQAINTIEAQIEENRRLIAATRKSISLGGQADVKDYYKKQIVELSDHIDDLDSTISYLKSECVVDGFKGRRMIMTDVIPIVKNWEVEEIVDLGSEILGLASKKMKGSQ